MKPPISSEPSIADIEAADRRIAPFIHRTPVLTCRTIDERSGARIFFKCENFQKGGAFKIRGACNTLFSLDDESLRRGVVTHSSGNHAAALALAARWRKTRAYVVMPETAPAVKKAAVASYGAEITLCPPTLADREAFTADIIARTGAVLVHPYNDVRIITGQATAALELCRSVEDLDVMMAPVGGGGLVSGTALAVAAVSPMTDVIAAEPAGADDAFRSLAAGRLILMQNPQTIADGLRTSLGDLTFPIIRRYVKAVVTVDEDEIVAAMRLVWERMKIIVEPSAAVPVAALLKPETHLAGKRVGVILSGGNVNLADLPFAAKPV